MQIERAEKVGERRRVGAVLVRDDEIEVPLVVELAVVCVDGFEEATDLMRGTIGELMRGTIRDLMRGTIRDLMRRAIRGSATLKRGEIRGEIRGAIRGHYSQRPV
jgi:hypothetical protein